TDPATPERYTHSLHDALPICPVIVYDYPASIKAFYMRLNDDEKTVRAMDVLVPRVGEIIGGSQREERLDVLERRMAQLNLNPEEDRKSTRLNSSHVKISYAVF